MRNFKTSSPIIQDSKFYSGGLFVAQLYAGLSTEKYETWILPIPYSDSYLNASGSILALAENSKEFNSVSEFIILYFNYPLDIICIYYSHIINGLTIQNPHVYIFNSMSNDLFLTLANSVFLAIFFITIYFFPRLRIDKLYCVFILILPAILTIPTQIEERFFLPLFVFIIAYTILYFKEFCNLLRCNRYFIFVFFVLIMYFIKERSQLNAKASIHPKIYGKIF